MMRKLLVIFLATLSQMVYAEFDGGVKFTDSQVRISTETFIKTVFGEKPPTLADRLKFEGGYESLENDETPLLYELCKHKYKVSTPEDSKECFDNIITPRLDNPSRYASLYYKLIRKKLGVSASELKIHSIRWVEGNPGKSSGGFVITVDITKAPRGTDSPMQLLIAHSPFQNDLRVVRIISITAPIQNYLGMSD